jgi:hypothetical protein
MWPEIESNCLRGRQFRAGSLGCLCIRHSARGILDRSKIAMIFGGWEKLMQYRALRLSCFTESESLPQESASPGPVSLELVSLGSQALAVANVALWGTSSGVDAASIVSWRRDGCVDPSVLWGVFSHVAVALIVIWGRDSCPAGAVTLVARPVIDCCSDVAMIVFWGRDSSAAADPTGPCGTHSRPRFQHLSQGGFLPSWGTHPDLFLMHSRHRLGFLWGLRLSGEAVAVAPVAPWVMFFRSDGTVIVS